MKKRVDLLLVDKNIAESRTKAKAMIMAGQISINGKKVLKSGETYEEDVNIHVTKLHPQWVSRGALKLCHAIQNFNIEIANLVCLDLGASTGGFTEVLLSKNVKKIYAVDVGSNQLHEKLKKDSRIVNLSKTNARYLNKDIIHDIIDIIVCDVSFISMKKVIQPSLQFLDEENGVVIGLIKPQFESKKNEIKRGGVIVDPAIHKRICHEYREWFTSTCNMKVQGIIPSPIKGPKGNIEFLIYAKK